MNTEPAFKEKSFFSGMDPVDNKNVTEIGMEETAIGTSELIYIDPKKEAAAFAKFDKYVLPVSIIFLVLSSLDRNNVSGVGASYRQKQC